MKSNATKIAGIGLLTAIVFVLQILGGFIHFGVFSISLVLAPIIVGAALYGIGAGAWLGLIFGIAVLVTGDAALFLGINPVGTVITVLVKGAVAGIMAGLVYKLIAKKSSLAGAIVAGITAPVCNTGVFLIGCRLFFFDWVKETALASGMKNAVEFMFVGLVGTNFLIELAINLVLATTIVKIIEIGMKEMKKNKK